MADREVQYGDIDPVVSRELFIRRALVEGDFETRHRFFAENRKLLGGSGSVGSEITAPRYSR